MKVEYPNPLKVYKTADLNGMPVYLYLSSCINFYSQTDENNSGIIAKLKLKSWKH